MEREDILEDLPEFDEVELHKKYPFNGRKAIKNVERVIKEYEEENNPIEGLLKKGGIRDSKMQKEINDSRDWLENNFRELTRFLSKEVGIERVQIRTFFIKIPRKIHECYKIDFPFENLALGYHTHGIEFAFYMSSTLENIGSIYDTELLMIQEQFVKAFYKLFMTVIPIRQLKAISQLTPAFFSHGGIDPAPRFNMEIEAQKSKAYGSLYLRLKNDLPFYLFMPIYASNTEEVPIVVTPNLQYDIVPLIEAIAGRIGVDYKEIKDYRYIDLTLDFEEIKNATALGAAEKIRTTYHKIDLNAAKEFLNINYRDLSATENTSISNENKGEDFQELPTKISKSIRERYFSSRAEVFLDPLFGPKKGNIPIDQDIREQIGERFRKDKAAILKSEE
ncbi:MAG: hypothetical protein WBA22_01520 [Candidatus Methanofastidiosia archaeon]